MARRVVVTGSGCLSPLGDTPAVLHAALVAGRRGLAPASGLADDGLPVLPVGQLAEFDPRAYLGEGNLRPLDRLSQLVAAATGRALADAGWIRERLEAAEVGLVLGTMLSGVHTIGEFDRRGMSRGPAYASPMDFANTVINAAAGQAAIWHGLRGTNATVSAAAASGLQAVGHAADLIRAGRAEVLLAGGADELCFETYLSFVRDGCLATEAPRPFDARRRGFAPAEGAALLVLEEAGAAAARGARVLAEVRGWGTAFDPSRGSEPARARHAGERAVSRALAAAGVEPGELAAVSTAANGSEAGDRSEAEGLAAGLAGRPSPLAATAIKSMLGEALGASGALQAVDLVESFTSGTLPGVVGLEEPFEGFPRELLDASSEARELPPGPALVTGGGIDGPRVALVLGRP